uniref:Uncharacterized protein n=1 Tax=Anguilla anguilla TaxID=7936 RepID=A0A0E9QZM3_ANGAN
MLYVSLRFLCLPGLRVMNDEYSVFPH